MALHADGIAARILVCIEAEKVTSKIPGEDGARMFGYYSGQRDAYEKAFGENYNWSFPEDWNMHETIAEIMDAFKPRYRAQYLESALTACNARDYLTVDHETGTLEHVNTEGA